MPLLKMSGNSWYSSRIPERSIGSPVGATDLPDSVSFTRFSWKLCEPGRRQAHRNAATLIMEMDGGGGSEVRGVGSSGVRWGYEGSTREFGSARVGSCSRAASPEGVNSAGPLWSVGWKVMWFLNQLINRLYCHSQLYLRTAEQEELSNVT